MGADASVRDGWSSISFPALPSLVLVANLILGPFLVLGPVMIATSKTDRLFIGTLLVFVVSLLYMVNSHRTVLFREHGRTSLTLQKWWFLPTFITESRTEPGRRLATKTRDGSAGEKMELHPSLTDAAAPIIG